MHLSTASATHATHSENASITPGRTIVVGTQQGLHATVARLATPELRLSVVTDAGDTCSTVMDLRDHESLVTTASEGGFWSYVAGTAYRLVTDFELAGCGLSIKNHTTTLPLKKGLSSSAAICVLVGVTHWSSCDDRHGWLASPVHALPARCPTPPNHLHPQHTPPTAQVARAFNRLFNLRLSTRGEMQYAYEGERLTPSRCGKMDQALAFGCRPVLMTYDGDVLHIRPLQLKAPLYLVLVDLRAAKDTVTILSALQVVHVEGCACGGLCM